MRRLSGQAARHLGVVLHRLATIALGLAVLLAVLLAVGAWRLSRGPIDLAWLTQRIEAAANEGNSAVRWSVGGTALAWEGFRLGADRPIDLRLSDIRLTTPGEQRSVDVPNAQLSLSLLGLLTGRLRPRAIILDRPQLTIRVAADGTPRLDLGAPDTTAEQSHPGEPVSNLLAAIAQPPGNGSGGAASWFSQMRELHIRGAAITVIDERLALTWHAPQADIDLHRAPNGGISGALNLAVTFGAIQARLIGVANVAAGMRETNLTLSLTPIVPAALARIAPRLARLSMLDAPVAASLTATLGPTLAPRHGSLRLTAGAGTLWLGDGSTPIIGGSLALSGTQDAIHIDEARLILGAGEGKPATTLTAQGDAQRSPDGFAATLALGLDRIDFADLPTLWPTGIAHNARDWIVRNITAGTAHDGHAEFTLAAPPDLSTLVLTQAGGNLQGDGLTVSWLQPAPPIVHGTATLRVLDPDTLRIDVAGGQQTLRSGGTLALRGGTVRITGMIHKDQVAAIDGNIDGSVRDMLGLLREPRLHLLDRHPIDLTDPAGDAVVHFTANVPLEHDVTMDDVAVHAAAHLTNAHLGGIVAGQSLDQGTLDLEAGNDGLTVKGQALLANIPTRLDAAMDFRAGPPNEVIQRITVTGTPDARQLAAAGLDATDYVAGPIGLKAVLSEQRDGDGSVAVEADLDGAAVTVAPLEWRKPAGRAAHATATLRLQHDRLLSIDDVRADSQDATLRGSATCIDGRLASVRMDRIALGRSDLQGTIQFPPRPRAAPIEVAISGQTLDLSARLDKPRTPSRHATQETPPGPPWTLSAQFDRVLAADGTLLAHVTINAANNGSIYQRLRVDGLTRDKGPFSLQIVPQNNTRHLLVTAVQTGDLLHALGLTDTMRGGNLSVSATFDDTRPTHPLQGDAELTDFHVSHAAALGKLLQAMTLYGLVDVLKGPGIAFSRMVAPFSLGDDVLELRDARAFSPSLGLTAKGRIDIDAQQTDLQGTIVPAYFFNSLLGNVPLVGRLFSPERGGGVFAASYSMHGRSDDPDVTVNPLTALTPGFLRGLFRIF